MEVGCERHAPAALPPGCPGTHCIRDWVGRRAALEGVENSPLLEFDPRTFRLVTSRYIILFLRTLP